METGEIILPDLQSCLLCEDVRCELNGMQTLVGVVNVIPAPALPVTCMRLCIWARWCSGTGKFKQRSRIVGKVNLHVVQPVLLELDAAKVMDVCRVSFHFLEHELDFRLRDHLLFVHADDARALLEFSRSAA